MVAETRLVSFGSTHLVSNVSYNFGEPDVRGGEYFYKSELPSDWVPSSWVTRSMMNVLLLFSGYEMKEPDYRYNLIFLVQHKYKRQNYQRVVNYEIKDVENGKRRYLEESICVLGDPRVVCRNGASVFCYVGGKEFRVAKNSKKSIFVALRQMPGEQRPRIFKSLSGFFLGEISRLQQLYKFWSDREKKNSLILQYAQNTPLFETIVGKDLRK